MTGPHPAGQEGPRRLHQPGDVLGADAGPGPLTDDIHLPAGTQLHPGGGAGLIRAYGELGEEGLWKNIEVFLKKVIPVAEECGVVMALHPDDPPYPIFGLPRVITCEENLDRYLSIVDSPSNALCLCTGSLGCAKFNDVPPRCAEVLRRRAHWLYAPAQREDSGGRLL